jgi:hypothetical protein
MDFNALDANTLRLLLTNPLMGETARERIRARLERLGRLEPVAIATVQKPKAPRRGEKNRTESRYERDVLAPMLSAGQCLRYEYEPLTFHVHEVRASYTPDFVVTLHDGSLWCIEVKRQEIHAASVVRLKAHAAARPWIRWTLVRWKDRRWDTLHDLNTETARSR